MNDRRSFGPALRQRGISLIEMMVGLVIGIICVLIILQVLSLWEGRKRTTSSGNDAQISGTLGAYSIDRDLRLAGYGFGIATSDVMGCAVKASNSSVSPSDVTFNLRPVEIIKETGKPDEIRVLYGNSAYFVSSQPLEGSAAETKSLKSREGFLPGDRMLITGNTPMDCELVEITGRAVTDSVTVEHKVGEPYGMVTGGSQTAVMNPAGGTGTTFNKGRVYNLGPAPVQSIWKVDTARGSLTRYNRLAEAADKAVEVASDVVTLKAQYGIDTSGDGVIAESEWVDTAPLTTDWTQVRAIRFATLIRSRQYERPMTDSGTATAVTPSAPAWAGGTFAMKNVDGSDDSGPSVSAISGDGASNNWRNYRYRVYEAVVPLRNMIWGTAP